LTGEGCYDATSFTGKAPSKVIELAKRHQKGVVVICGQKKIFDEMDQSIPIFDLLSMFTEEYSMKYPQECLEGLLIRKAKTFPILSELK